MTIARKPGGVNVSTIKVSIIEDHGIVRAGLRMLLDNQPGMEVVGESSTASEAIKSAQGTTPDVILLDLDLGQENGLDFLSQLLDKFQPARVLILTAIADLKAHLLAVIAGASGIVMKEQAPESLVQAIQTVHSGQAWLGRAITPEALAKICQANVEQKQNPETAKISLLTAREREIVTLVSLGYNSARIAAHLTISEATVRNHLTSILSKLELSNKFELAVFAFRHGLNAKARANLMGGEIPTIPGYRWIVVDPDLLGGQPTVRGTRLSVSHILACLSEGMTAAEIAEDYPGFPPESLPEILKFASENLDRRTGGDDAAA